ncbi:ABC transporter ATP-binding protein [Acidisoma cellulosilytica]|uniref:ABC transporter ATP-binding protein n=1 Tax=Acidisoma cellulosilyticum TaxID=2802395 RepID=A0A963Z1U4_9PROT|nr:ABC transporter ATP-binding protein [Acidisoma cellulosilyticum]MCB8881278.1 ABC transporter ATP-binding protein [Acidisoma cellulosilyticum]
MSAMLELSDVEVRYGRLVALRGLSLEVHKGEVVCLIGPNGAGKSTAMAAIAGGVPRVAGSIRLNGQELPARKPEQIARLGLSLVPEGRHVFGTLTVEENLRVGGFLRGNARESAAALERVAGYFPRLKERWTSPAGRLSGGEQQMLSIGRALMTNPRLVMVDEPSLGLAPLIVDAVYEILLELREREGLTLLINEQSSHRILRFADRIYVIRNGTIQLHGTAEALRDGEAIKAAYFGFKGTGANANVVEGAKA